MVKLIYTYLGFEPRQSDFKMDMGGPVEGLVRPLAFLALLGHENGISYKNFDKLKVVLSLTVMSSKQIYGVEILWKYSFNVAIF